MRQQKTFYCLSKIPLLNVLWILRKFSAYTFYYNMHGKRKFNEPYIFFFIIKANRKLLYIIICSQNTKPDTYTKEIFRSTTNETKNKVNEGYTKQRAFLLVLFIFNVRVSYI